MIVIVALAASALLGLALGLIFRVWINLIAAPVVGVGTALALASSNMGFLKGIAITFACILANQIAYLIGTLLAPSDELSGYLAEDVLDAQPSERGKQGIADKQEHKRAKDPSWPPPPGARRT